MVDQDRIASLIATGMSRAAERLGSPYSQFRPTGPNEPLSSPILSTILCSFDPSTSLSFTATEARRGYGASMVGDSSSLAPGDYLFGRDTWFVSHIEPLRPPSCVLCNRVISILSPVSASAPGTNDYGGRTTSTDVSVATGWPASVLAKSHIEMDPTRLPSDTKAAFFEVLLPAIPDTSIEFGFRITDDLGSSYLVSSVEISVIGWRLSVAIQTT